MRLPAAVRSLAFAVTLALSCVAQAQAEVAAKGAGGVKRTRDEAAQVRLRYGVAIRSGAEADSGPGLSYSGVTPNDLALTGWLWLLSNETFGFGLTAAGQREAFSLLDGDRAVTSGGLIRAHVGPTGRVRLGPVRLEAAVGYAFQQLPVFGTVSEPAFSTVQRHGILLAARGLVDLGPVTLEGRFEYPIALATVGRDVRSQGLGAGGALRVQLFRTGSIKWGLLAEAQWNQDSLTTLDESIALTASQSVVRAGVALDLQWKDPVTDEAVRTAGLSISVRTAEGPLPGARVQLTGPAPRATPLDQKGEAKLGELEPGEWVVTAAAAGYVEAQSQVSLVAGDDKTVSLVLEKEKPKVGGLVVKVVSFEGKAPVAATLEVNGASQQTTPEGALSLEGLSPGPLSVKATAPGFTPGEEAVSVVAGTQAELTIVLVPEKKRVPATLRGQVRSARGGKPVVAQLEIREIKQTISADEAGAFSVQLPGGKYTVRIVAPGFITQNKTVTVRDGDQAIFNVDLSPK